MSPVGIEALNVYGGQVRIGVRDLATGRGLDPARFDGESADYRSVTLPFEDPVTNAVNAAAPLVEGLSPEQRSRIEFVITATESGLDLSKSLASSVHAALGLDKRCRLLETKQACFAATAALQLAAGFIASGFSPGAKALLIATDIPLADADAQYAEPVAGHGAVAMLIGDDPGVLALDPGASGNHSFDVLDTARPSPREEIADPDVSLLAYLDCLKGSFADYCDRVEGADLGTSFDRLAFHTPFSGMARAAHRALLRSGGRRDGRDVAADYEARVSPSLYFPGQVGNLFSGSVYLALASSIARRPPERYERVGLFSYGSGCSSEFFSGQIGPESARRLAPYRIEERLEARTTLTFAQYTELQAITKDCLVPLPRREVDIDRFTGFLNADRPRLFALTGAQDYRRSYAWI